MFKQYLEVIKPSIIISNLISMIGGFLLASKENINYNLLVFTTIGVALLIGSGCVFNNYIDRDIDKDMERTKNRVLAKGLISPINSLIYAISLGVVGSLILWFSVNPLITWLGIVGFLVYVIIYSLYMKRYSIYSTMIGSLSGAVPPVIGYCAVTKKIDGCAVILASIFSLWQIPHSYAIAILRFKDYKAANIPVLPVIKGILATKNRITLYIIAFITATLTLFLTGYTGYKYLIVTVTIDLCWLCIALYGYKIYDNKLWIWAQKLFIFSIIAITSLSVMMSIDFIH